MQHNDPHGYSFTTANDEAAVAFISAHENLLRWKSAVLPGLKAALAADPGFGLELRGINVGDRWDELAELTLDRLEDHSSPFTSAHFAVILAATGRFEQAEALIVSMREFAIADQGTLGPRYLAAAIPAAKAAVAHRKEDHQRVVDLLLPVHHQLWQMGGSHAQRDLFFLLLADSARALSRGDLLAIVLDDVAWAGIANPASRVGYRDAAALL